ncbi:hypothetical protein [Pseudonocardia xishanensis]|uniref:Signal transduction histidine kinase n=1 Tax=Pseudonocardia xishanensis TaxID=630995 RepID=A0ABP8S4A1_9PSEU
MTPAERELSARLQRGLRVARTVIVLAILLGLNLPNLVAGSAAYHPGWAGYAGWAVLVAVAAADAVLVARHRFWGVARWPAAVLVLGVAVAMTLALSPAELGGPPHVTLGVIGWFGVLLFARIGELVGFVGVHLTVMLGFLVAAGRTDQVTLVAFGITALGVTSFQLAVGIAGSAMNSVARQAAAAAAEEAESRTAEELAAVVHADRERRYSQVRAVALPLLERLAAGSADPADPGVQRAAAGAAARLRRMFAEEGDDRDPLAAELAALIDIAERRGVDVQYSQRGGRPEPPPPVAQDLLAAAGAALHAARSAARVTLAGVDGAIVVGVVTDGDPGPVAAAAPQVETATVVGDGQTWVEARWAPRGWVAR